MKNGRDIGREHLATLQAFVRDGTPAPMGRGGSLNLAELSRITGIPKSSFYQNPKVRALANTLRTCGKTESSPKEAGGENWTVGSDTSARRKNQLLQQLERRVNTLEQRSAVIVAENAMLRRQLRALQQQLARQDMMIDTGKRIVAPPMEDG